MAAAFDQVSKTKQVTLDEAEKLNLFDPNSPDDALNINKDGLFDIPCWCYAIINLPHPLLEKGLVIYDAPGLNAIGTEPELTLNMLPSADAVFLCCQQILV